MLRLGAPAVSWEAASIISVREVHQLRPAVKEETMTPSFRLLALLLLLLSPRDGFGMAIGRFTRPPPKAQQTPTKKGDKKKKKKASKSRSKTGHSGV